MGHDIPLAVPSLTGREAEYLQECVASGFVSSVGPFVTRFEETFATRVGAAHAVACASGTAALHLAMVTLGVGPGDTVAVSDLTFVASANAVHYTGAQPVLVDSEPRTWNLDSALLHDWCVAEAAAGRPLPAAIEAVHVLGQPADVEPLLALRDRFGIPLVEDAAEALGAGYREGPVAGHQVGTVGALGCFSFNGNKIITAGGGGMVVTDDEDQARRVRHLSTQAKLPGLGYHHDEVGFNHRMTNLSAAVGLAQLEQLDAFLARKRAIAATYDAALADLAEVTLPPRVGWADPSSWLYSILLPDQGTRDRVLTALVDDGIGARPLWAPVSSHRPYRDAPRVGGEVARDLADRGLSLPCSVTISDDELAIVVAAVRAALARA